MPDVMMMLGGYMFSVDTAAYQQLIRSSEYRWKNQERIGARDALQFTGGGANERMQLSGDIYPQFNLSLVELQQMRRQASLGLPLILVAGTGEIFGRWVIINIDEQQDLFFKGGAPKRQKFTMSLIKYDDGPLPG